MDSTACAASGRGIPAFRRLVEKVQSRPCAADWLFGSGCASAAPGSRRIAMLMIPRTLTRALVYLLTSGIALLIADESTPIANQPHRTEQLKPQLASARAATIDPDLQTILREWERACSGRRRLDARFTRFKYDHTFEVEKRGNGSMAVDSSGRGVYRVVPANLAPGEISRKKNSTGIPYTLKADGADCWHWTGQRVIRVDEAERTFEEMVLPNRSEDGSYLPDPPSLPEEAPLKDDESAANEKAVAESQPAPPALPQDLPQRPARMTFRETLDSIVIICLVGIAALSRAETASPDSVAFDFAAFYEAIREFVLPRPFLLGTTAKDLMRRFHIKLVQQDDSEIRLEFRPREKRDKVRFDRAILILKRGEYIPVAFKMVDVTRAESVHVFTDVKIDGDSISKSNPFVRFERLDRPSLQGYRQLLPPAAASSP
jgi:hypothetical protein